MSSYSYNPAECMDGGVNQMRFELGDTVVEQGEITSALCDEEYSAIISACSSWKRAKFKCLQSILMKFSYEVDTEVDGLSYGLSKRAERWQMMYDSLKKDLSVAVPRANKASLSPPNGEHYFYGDMHSNPRKG